MRNCPTCEILKMQLASIERERDRLLDHILERPTISGVSGTEPVKTDDTAITKNRFIPWSVRKQMLESEDRQRALLLDKQKKDQHDAITALEKKLNLEKGIVEDNRPVHMMGRSGGENV